MKNLTKAIISVMKSVKGMEKKSKVGQGRYAYDGTRDQDVKEVFNQSLAENGLCLIPAEIDETVEVYHWNEGPKRKQSVFTRAKCTYLLMHESGESTTIQGIGHGFDSMDKSAGKATTYALKNALLYTFLTPVGKIDDADTTHSKEMQAPQMDDAEAIKMLNVSKSLEELKTAWLRLSSSQQIEMNELKERIKTRLS